MTGDKSTNVTSHIKCLHIDCPTQKGSRKKWPHKLPNKVFSRNFVIEQSLVNIELHEFCKVLRDPLLKRLNNYIQKLLIIRAKHLY